MLKEYCNLISNKVLEIDLISLEQNHLQKVQYNINKWKRERKEKEEHSQKYYDYLFSITLLAKELIVCDRVILYLMSKDKSYLWAKNKSGLRPKQVEISQGLIGKCAKTMK